MKLVIAARLALVGCALAVGAGGGGGGSAPAASATPNGSATPVAGAPGSDPASSGASLALIPADFALE